MSFTPGPALTAEQLGAVGYGYGVQGTVAAILAAGLPAQQAANLLAQALRSAGINPVAAQAAIALAGTAASPVTDTTTGGVAVANQAAAEAQMQALYLIAAAERLEQATVTVVPTGSTTVTPTATTGASWTQHAELRSNLTEALRNERRYKQLHDQAARHRMNAATAVDTAADQHGRTLGWYLGQAKQHTPVCRAAAGHDFDAQHRPLPGWPGTSHAMCACHPGPPHGSRLTVDEVARPLIAAGLD